MVECVSARSERATLSGGSEPAGSHRSDRLDVTAETNWDGVGDDDQRGHRRSALAGTVQHADEGGKSSDDIAIVRRNLHRAGEDCSGATGPPRARRP
jgi:hypothetical protein